MRLFDRRIAVTIGPEGGTGRGFDERFQIEFSVLKTIGQEQNRIDCTIYGLSEERRQEIVNGGEVIQIEAGYAEGTEVLAIGDITRAVVENNPPEIRTVIEAGDGARALRNRKVHLSFEAGASVQRVLDRIAQELALGRKATGVVVSGSYREGVSFSGKAKDALDAVTRKAGVTWSIQDGDLQILPREEAAQGRGVLLSPQTGLIESPRQLDDETMGESRRSGAGYEVRSLLNPKIRPGEQLLLAAGEVGGTYRVDTVEHKGSVRGNDWYSVAEVFAGD